MINQTNQNTEELQKLYQELEQYSKELGSTWENDNNFIEIADKIIEYKDPTSIPILLQYFDDENCSWALESLKTGIENFDDQDYTKGVIFNLDIMVPKATYWVVCMMYPIFADDALLNILYDNLCLINKHKLLLSLHKIEECIHKSIKSKLKDANTDPKFYQRRHKQLNIITNIRLRLNFHKDN